jgi:hypothetical protein
MPDDEQHPVKVEASSEAKETTGSDNIKESTAEKRGQQDKDSDPRQEANLHQKMRADSGHITSVVGDHTSLIFNFDYSKQTEEVSRGSRSDNNSDEIIGADPEEILRKYLAIGRQSTVRLDNAKTEKESGSTEPPKTEEEISDWYYSLDEDEACYVQAAAILHGAPAFEISKRADILFKRMIPEATKDESQSKSEVKQDGQRSEQVRETKNISASSLRKKPVRELRRKTHTITRRVDGIERLFWQDVDVNGTSSFGPRFLTFLADEFISKGEHGEQFLDELRIWSEQNDDECAQRSARAYGVILWYQNVGQLRRTAESWAKTTSLRGRYRAASLLDSAHEIDFVLHGEQANDSRTSPVLQLLDEWVDSAHELSSRTKVNLGCAAAYTYSLIGIRSPEVAIRGLERVLQFPQSKATIYSLDLYYAGVWNYQALIGYGHIRHVLEHLAASAEQLSCHWRQDLPVQVDMRHQYRQQRKVSLNATLDIFYLIAKASLVEEDSLLYTSYSYDEPLPPYSAIPDPQGKDLILAGLLSSAEVQWRENIIKLLCSAILEKESRSAFYLLRQWAEIVLKMQRIQVENAEVVYESFRQFIVNLGKKVDEWCLELDKQGLQPPQANFTFKNRLKQWCKESRLGSLAQDVLDKLGS